MSLIAGGVLLRFEETDVMAGESKSLLPIAEIIVMDRQGIVCFGTAP